MCFVYKWPSPLYSSLAEKSEARAMTSTTLEEDYAQAGFGGALSPGGHPALILVDFARAYFDRDCGLYAGVEAERDVAADLARAARAAGVPVIFTRVEYCPGDPARDGGVFYRKVPALTAFDAGNPMGDFTAALRPEAGDHVVTKQYPSAFFGTGLADTLHHLNIDTCLIGGLTTSGCVRATTLDALCHGFVPLVVREACGDRDLGVQDANLFDLQAKYAEVIARDAALAYLGAIARR
jgi:maleamate amidohydrolase